MKARLWQKGAHPSNASSQQSMPPVSSAPYSAPVNYNGYVPYDPALYPTVMQVVMGNVRRELRRAGVQNFFYRLLYPSNPLCQRVITICQRLQPRRLHRR